MGRRVDGARASHRSSLLAAVASAFVVLTVVAVAARRADVTAACVQAACSVLATAAAAEATARSSADGRPVWRLLTAATALWTLAAVGRVVQLDASSEPSFPALADWLRVPAVAAALAGLFVLSRRLPRRGGSKTWLETLVLTASLLYLTWALRLGDSFATTDLSGAGRAALLVSWLLDLLLVAASVHVVAWSPSGARRALVVLAAGFIIIAVTDVAFTDRSLVGVEAPGPVFDLVWGLGLLLVAWAAVRSGRRAARAAARAGDRRILVSSLLTFVPFVVVVVVSVRRGVDLAEPVAWPELLLLVVTAALFLFAQATTMRENLSLTGGLADTVEARTRELGGAVRLQDLTLEAVDDGIIGFHEGRVVLTNDAACELLRLTRTELLGRLVFEVITIGPDDHSLLATIWAALAAGEQFVVDDEEVRRADGSAFHIELSITPVLHDRLTSVAVFRDVSHRHEVERMKDEFVSVVSHELRTPLTSIRGSLGLLGGGVVGELPEQGQRMVEIATENTDRLIRLINDILDLERMESGAVGLHREDRPIAALVAEAIRVVTPVADAASVELRGDDVDDGLVSVDADRIVQTLTNLLANAVKFSPPGTAVRVSARRSGADVVVRVADQGRGIPAEQLEAIFGRFQQVDASDSRLKGGTGLGLAISRSIVEQHGGRIWAESRPGAGSTFSFTVPVPEPAVGLAMAADGLDIQGRT
jgi:PAS domain S-box-containing protein